MSTDFASFVRTVARGAHLGRPLTIDEARTAMAMILDGEAEPEQIGAFLMVLRYRTETPEEIAGLVLAARARLAFQAPLDVDLDWPSYADAHRQLPYFVLAARLLAQNGVRVLMHGIEGAGTATTRAGLAVLGMRFGADAASAESALDETGFVYLPLESLCPPMAALFALKRKLGLRSCIHTAARELNPSRAPAQIQGVFHPTYLELHRGTQALLDQPAAITFKGSGGEGQRNPCKPCSALVRRDGASFETRWYCKDNCDHYPWRDEPLDVDRIRALWQGDSDADAPRRAVTGTTAMCLWLMERANTPDEAESMAEAMWLARAPRQAAA